MQRSPPPTPHTCVEVSSRQDAMGVAVLGKHSDTAGPLLTRRAPSTGRCHGLRNAATLQRHAQPTHAARAP